MSAPQYNNSGKYTTYMHITIGHNLLPLFVVFLSPREGHGRKKNWWIFIFMAKKLSFLPSVHPMRKRRAGKQNFTQVSPWANYRIIPNKRTAPNKHAPPFSCTLYIQSDGLKKSTRHQPSVCSIVNMVEPRPVCCERGCKRGMLLLHVA